MFCLLFLLFEIIFLMIFPWKNPFCLVLWLNTHFSEKHSLIFLSVVATKLLLQQTYHISVEYVLPLSLRQPFHSCHSIYKYLALHSFSLILCLCSYFYEKQETLVRVLQHLPITASFIWFLLSFGTW